MRSASGPSHLLLFHETTGDERLYEFHVAALMCVLSLVEARAEEPANLWDRVRREFDRLRYGFVVARPQMLDAISRALAEITPTDVLPVGIYRPHSSASPRAYAVLVRLASRSAGFQLGGYALDALSANGAWHVVRTLERCRRLAPSEPLHSYRLAALHCFLTEHDRAFELLEELRAVAFPWTRMERAYSELALAKYKDS